MWLLPGKIQILNENSSIFTHESFQRNDAMKMKSWIIDYYL